MGTLIIILIFSKSFLKLKIFSDNMLYYGYHKITPLFLKKGNSKMDITEGIKKIFLAGVGAVATTGEAAKNLIDNLVEKGELTVEQGKVLNEGLKRNTKEKINKHVTVNVVNEFKDVFSAVDKMSKEELEALKEKLESLKDAAPAEEEEAKEDCGCEEECSCEEKTETCDGENCDNK